MLGAPLHEPSSSRPRLRHPDRQQYIFPLMAPLDVANTRGPLVHRWDQWIFRSNNFYLTA